jgi:NAD(P)-dependent dehydrogenase (short-subunit alcohol dehydrogenase family)
VASGGAAVADHNDISTPGGALAVVETAVEQFGRVDVVVNNAGIVRWGSMPDVEPGDVGAHLAVHTLGSFHTARAAWPHMVEREYGRIVMTTSTGVLGLRGNLAYATAKGGVIGLARTLAVEGAKHGIKVNGIAPAAVTRMVSRDDEDLAEGAEPPEMSPDLVAPMVAYLAHEDCPVTGEIYTAGGGRFARVFIAATEGYVHAGSAPPTIDDVAEHWAAINDESDYSVPADLESWSRAFLEHLG